MDKIDLKVKLEKCTRLCDYQKLALDEDVISFLKKDAIKNKILKPDNNFLMGRKGEQDENKAKIVIFNLPQGITSVLCPFNTWHRWYPIRFLG